MVVVGERDVCRASQDIIPIDGAGEPVAARCEDRELAHFETARDALSKSKAGHEAVIFSRRLRSLLPTAPGSARVHFPVLSATTSTVYCLCGSCSNYNYDTAHWRILQHLSR